MYFEQSFYKKPFGFAILDLGHLRVLLWIHDQLPIKPSK